MWAQSNWRLAHSISENLGAEAFNKMERWGPRTLLNNTSDEKSTSIAWNSDVSSCVPRYHRPTTSAAARLGRFTTTQQSACKWEHTEIWASVLGEKKSNLTNCGSDLDHGIWHPRKMHGRQLFSAELVVYVGEYRHSQFPTSSNEWEIENPKLKNGICESCNRFLQANGFK